MISLFNYLQECGDCATPSNTIGMGNPMPADIGVEGTEPLVGSKKKKKKKIKESIFDDEEEILDNTAALSSVRDWVETSISNILGKYYTSKQGNMEDKYTIKRVNGKYKVSFKLKNLCANITEEIPEYIILDLTNVKALDIELSKDCKGNERNKFVISNDNFIFGANTHLYIFLESPQISEIEFDGEFNCKLLNVSDSVTPHSPNKGLKHIILRKNYKCNWTVYGGLKNLKKISCVGGIPTVINGRDHNKIMLPEFPGQHVEIVKI